MSRVAALKQRVSRKPVGTFLTVLVLYSGLAASARYGTFESAIPTPGVIFYAWAPMISAEVTVWVLDESVRDWLG